MENVGNSLDELQKLVTEHILDKMLGELETKIKAMDALLNTIKDSGTIASNTINEFSLGRVFKDELTFISENIFNSIEQLTKHVDVLCQKLADKDDAEARSLPELIKENLAKIQQAVDMISKKTPDQFMNIDQISRISNEYVPHGQEVLEGQVQLTTEIGSIKETFMVLFDSIKEDIQECMKDIMDGEGLKARYDALLADFELQKQRNLELQSRIDALIAEQAELKEKMALEANKNLADRLHVLKEELQHAMSFLEKSPRYQVLFTLSNVETIKLDRLVEITSLNEGLARKVVSDLEGRGLVAIDTQSGVSNIRILKKLNPIGGLTLDQTEDIISLDLILKAIASSDESFVLDPILSRVNIHVTAGDHDKAGYLLSLILLWIHSTKAFKSIRKIENLIEALLPSSFYLRMMHNLLQLPYPVTYKNSIIDGLIKEPDLVVFSKELERVDTDKLNSQPPLMIETISLKSHLGVSVPHLGFDSTAVFQDINALVHYAWLNSPAMTIEITISDATDTQHTFLVSNKEPEQIELYKTILSSAN